MKRNGFTDLIGLAVCMTIAPVTLAADLALNAGRMVKYKWERRPEDAPTSAEQLVDHATVTEWFADKLYGD